MMKSADFRQRNHGPKIRRLHRPTRRRVLFQGQVRPSLVIIRHKRFQVTIQTGLVENDHVVGTLAPNRPNHALDVGPLPAERGAESTSLMPRFRTSLVKSATKMPSRSRRRYRGTCSNGK